MREIWNVYKHAPGNESMQLLQLICVEWQIDRLLLNWQKSLWYLQSQAMYGKLEFRDNFIRQKYAHDIECSQYSF